MITLIGKALKLALVERRLPYGWSRKLQEVLYKGSLEKHLASIAYSSPYPCAPSASTELHMVTCTRDLTMAIAACKSFLRFYADITIVFHGDPSLSEKHAQSLQTQIPGCRVFLYGHAENIAKQNPEIFQLRSRMPDRFKLGSGYENHRKAWALKIFDFHLLSEASKIIVLDSDTLFLRSPDEIIAWLNSDSPMAFFSTPRLPNLKIPPEIFTKHFPNANTIERFNGGLYGFDKRQVPIEVLADVATIVIAHPEIPIFGDECLWRLAFSHIQSSRLEFEEYPLITGIDRKLMQKIRSNQPKYIHFILKHRGGFYGSIAKSVAKEILS